MTGETDVVDAPPVRASRPGSLRSGHTLVAAMGIAILSVIAVLADASWVLLGVLCAVAALAVAVAVASTMRVGSQVIAPLAVCVLALGNPLVFSALQRVAVVEFATISVSPDGGLVDWEKYPGIAGWEEALIARSPIEAGALATSANGAVRAIVDALTDEHGYAWTTVPCPAGVLSIPNGFGGGSAFERIESVSWVTESFDGSAHQRASILGAMTEAASRLGLEDVGDPEGDVSVADGSRQWRHGSQSLTVTIGTRDVSVSFRAGPYLSGRVSDAEYERSMARYLGLAQPTPTDETGLSSDGSLLPACSGAD